MKEVFKIQFFKLTKSACQEMLQNLILADAGTLGERWDEIHFSKDMPGKWDFSFYCLNEQSELVAYIINSIKNPTWLHIHRFVVIQKFRNRGIGNSMLNHIKMISKNAGISRICLKVHQQNHSAISFYIRNGFSIIDHIGENLEMDINL